MQDDGDPEADAKRLASLLEHGAHGLLGQGAEEVGFRLGCIGFMGFYR